MDSFAMSFRWLYLLCTVVALTMGQQPLVGSETPQPAHLLRPRNYNPHPYESRSHVLHRQDYIYAQLQSSPFQYQLLPYALPSSPERNPYGIIKGQRDYLSNNRVPNRLDHESYTALANHAEKVLQQQQNSQDYLNRKYAFEYTANDIYHSQQQDDQGLVKGSYEVPLPDGRVQIVQYTADGNGYHPEISYKGEVANTLPQSSAYSVASQVPVTVRTPVQRGSVVVYPNEEEEVEDVEAAAEVEGQAPRSYYTSTTISGQPQAVQYNNYGLLTGLPRPYGTVKTAGSQYNNAAPRYAGRIQYVTYEDVVDSENPSTPYYGQ